MLAAFLSNPTAILLSCIVLAAGVAIWVALSGSRACMFSLGALLLVQSANTITAALSTPQPTQVTVVISCAFVLSAIWIMTTLSAAVGESARPDKMEPRA